MSLGANYFVVIYTLHSAPENLYEFCWSRLKDGKSTISCPSPDCGQNFDLEEIKDKASLTNDEEGLFKVII